MGNILGIVTSASNRYKIEGMQDYRPVGAFSFAGRYRLIDFPISNLSNSGCDHFQIYISGNPRSLVGHLGTGRIYNINSKRGKFQVMFRDEGHINPIYNTDIEFFMEHIHQTDRARQEYVIIAPSNMVFIHDFKDMLDRHIESGADISLLYHRVESAMGEYLGCNVLDLNRQKGVNSITANKGNTKERNIFMDTYVMKKDLFVDLVRKAAKTSSIYHLSQIVSDMCATCDVRGVQHKGYFAAINDFKSYFDSSLALTDRSYAENLFRDNWPIYTRTTDACPTQYYKGASVRNSLVANGCIIEGNIENSVIGRDVRIAKDAVVKNCVILSNVSVSEGVHLENQVVDKWAEIKRIKEIVADPENPGYIKRDDIL